MPTRDLAYPDRLERGARVRFVSGACVAVTGTRAMRDYFTDAVDSRLVDEGDVDGWRDGPHRAPRRRGAARAARCRRAPSVESRFNARHMWTELADVIRRARAGLSSALPRSSDGRFEPLAPVRLLRPDLHPVGRGLRRGGVRQTPTTTASARPPGSSVTPAYRSSPSMPSAPTVVVTTGTPWHSASTVLNFTPAPWRTGTSATAASAYSASRSSTKPASTTPLPSRQAATRSRSSSEAPPPMNRSTASGRARMHVRPHVVDGPSRGLVVLVTRQVGHHDDDWRARRQVRRFSSPGDSGG